VKPTYAGGDLCTITETVTHLAHPGSVPSHNPGA